MLCRAGSGGGSEEEWHPISVTPLPVQVVSPTATSSHDFYLRDKFYHLFVPVGGHIYNI